MTKMLSVLLALSLVLVGCATQTPKPTPRPMPPLPPMPPVVKVVKKAAPTVPKTYKRIESVRGAQLLVPFKLAPTLVFSDTFTNANPAWKFYQGNSSVTNGVLRLSAGSNSGGYAYYTNGSWTNFSVQADIKMPTTAWGVGIGGRYNPTTGANYQVWLYASGRMTIEEYSDWFNTWSELASATVTAPGTNYHTVKMAITNNVITGFLDGSQKVTFTDTSSPMMGKGNICLSVWSTAGNITTADIDNLSVYTTDGSPTTNAPTIVVGLTNQIAYQGTDALLSVTADGNALAYQWSYQNSTIAGATNSTYTITNVQPSKAGTYSLTISNPKGTTNTSGYVVVGSTNILSNCLPANVTLAWCPSPDTNVNGYYIYHGSGIAPVGWTPSIYNPTNPCGPPISVGTNWFRAYTNRVDVGNVLSATVTNVPRGVTNFFAATAHNASALESDFSEEVMYKPPTLTNFSTTMTKVDKNTILLSAKLCPISLVTVWCKNNLNAGPWTALATNKMTDIYGNFFFFDPSDKPSRFYRLQLQ